MNNKNDSRSHADAHKILDATNTLGLFNPFTVRREE